MGKDLVLCTCYGWGGANIWTRGLWSWVGIYILIFGLDNDGVALFSLRMCLYTLFNRSIYPVEDINIIPIFAILIAACESSYLTTYID
jgi:hypothetical protein